MLHFQHDKINMNLNIQCTYGMYGINKDLILIDVSKKDLLGQIQNITKMTRV